MRNRYAFALLAILATGCSSSPSGQAGGGSGGGDGVDAPPTAGTGGAISTGGSSAGNGGAGGSNAGDSAAAASGGSDGADGSGGQGAPETGGADSGAAPAGPSAGCGKSVRPPGGRILVANDHIYDFPTTYDGQKPMPAVFMLHGANNPNTLIEGQTNGSRLAASFVRVFPKSNGAAWSYAGGNGADSQRLTAIYNDLLANHCVDTSRVFLVGHSSGAQMSVQMMCAPGGDKRFRAVAPVAASVYCNMLTPVPVMYIQGMMDAMRGNGNGAAVVAVFTRSNTCTATTMPYAPVAGCNSQLDGRPVNPGCISYQGCSKPTIWCSHNDNSYNQTDGRQHGWPCFANSAIADFFLTF